MNITTEQHTARIPVTIVRLQGELDGTNYLEVISQVKQLAQSGTRSLLVDMGNVPYMSSAGLVALHSAAVLLRGEEPPDVNAGWSALKSVASDRPTDGAVQQAVKLLNPQPRVARTLQMSGMDVFYESYTDEAAALASF